MRNDLQPVLTPRDAVSGVPQVARNLKPLVFIIVACAFSSSRATAQNVAPSLREQHTVAYLQQLLSAESKKVDIAEELTAYPRLQGERSTFIVSRGNSSLSNTVETTTQILDAEHLLIRQQWPDENRNDIITYDRVDQLYRRWRLVAGAVVGEWVGIGNADATVPTQNRVRTNVISWTRVTNAGESSLTTDTIELDTFTGKGKLIRRTAVMAAGELQRRDVFIVRSANGNHSDFEEPYQRLIAQKKRARGSLWERITGERSNSVYRFPKSNFTLQSPGEGFRNVDMSKINPVITVALIDNSIGRTVSVVDEKVAANQITTSTYLETIRGIAANANPDSLLTPNTESTVNNVQYSTFATIDQNRKGHIRVYSVAVYGDRAYQIITSTDREQLVSSQEFHHGVLTLFNLINRKAIPSISLTMSRPHYGVRSDPEQLTRLQARPVNSGSHEAEDTNSIYWLQFPNADELVVYAIDFEGIEVEDDLATEILMAKIGLNYPNEVVQTRQFQSGNAAGTELTFVATFVSGSKGSYVVRILRNDEHLLMLYAHTESIKPDAQQLLRRRLDAFKFEQPIAKPNRAQSEKNAHMVNALGVHIFNSDRIETGLKLIELARNRRPENALFASNYALMLEFAGQPERALKVATSALKQFPQNTTLLSTRAAALSQLRRYPEAIEAYQRVLEQQGFTEQHLFDYANTLLQLGRAADAADAYKKYMGKLNQPSMVVRREYCHALQMAELFDEAIQLAGELQKELPDNIELKEDLISAYVEARRAPDALREIEKLVKAGTATANCLYLKGRAFLIEKRYAMAKSAFEAGLLMAPGDPTLLDAINATSAALGEGDNSSIKMKLDVVKIPDAVQRAIEAQPEFQPDQGFNYQYTNQVSGISFVRGQSLRMTEYRECLVHNQAGVDALQKLQLRFDPTFERIYVNELQVIDASGNVKDERNVDQFYITSANTYGMATSEKYLNIPVSGLKPGHTLRYVFTRLERGAADTIPFKQTMFAGGTPSGSKSVFITGDLEDLVADTANAEFQLINEKRTRAWILPGLSTLSLEARQPPFNEYLPVVWFGSKKETWQSIGKEYLQRIRKPLEPSTEAATLAKTIVKQTDSVKEKTRTILRWIQDKMAYQALEFGVHAQIPKAASETIENRFGDCKDLCLLAMQMLRSQGIRSHLCLVSTELPVQLAVPDISQFDHVILYVPDIGDGVFVDCTSRFLDPLKTGTAAWSEKSVLVVDSSKIDFMTIPSDTTNDTRLDSKRVVTVPKDSNDVLVTESLTVLGSYASAMRSFLLETNAAEIESYLSQTLTDRQRAELVSYSPKNTSDYQKPLVIELTYRIRNAVRIRGSERQLDLPAKWEKFLLEEAVASERESPFELNSPLGFVSNVELEFPTGWKCETASSQTSVNNDWVQYRIQSAQTKNSLTLQSNIQRKAGQFDAEVFGDFQDAMNNAVELASPELRFSISNPPEAN